MELHVNGLPVVVTTFPGGEVKVTLPAKLSHDCDDYSVRAKIDSSEGVMALVMVTDALREWVNFDPGRRFSLGLPYFPYARQDRVCNPGEAHGVRAMAAIVNVLDYDSVVVLDPHSEAVGAALDRCHVIPQETIVKSVLGDAIYNGKWTLVSPDSGSEKKVNRVAKSLGSWGLTPPVLYASKQRNLATGEIISTTVHGDCTGREVLIVDDICDGGRTFIELAKVLRAGGATKVYLYVTHGIFSAGLDVLKEHIDHVWCAITLKGVRDSTYLTIGEDDV